MDELLKGGGGPLPCAPVARQHGKAHSMVVVLGMAGGTAGLVGCGDAVDTAQVARVGGERFQEIRFNELYRPPNATAKEKSTVDLVQTESFSLEGASPSSVVNAYSKVLTAQGWSEIQEPQAKRDKSWFGAWSKLGRNIVVTAEFGAPAVEGQPAPVDFVLAFQRPTKSDQITGIGNDPIAEK